MAKKLDKKLNLPSITKEPSSNVVLNDNNLYQYLRYVNSIPSLTQEEEFLLTKAYLEKNDMEAAHKLVVSHLKLVTKIALSYKNYGLPPADLISEGNIGLMHAVKKYNPDLGYRLSTYAMWWIKANIQEYVLKSWSIVKMGTTAAQKKIFFSLNKIKRKLSNIYQRHASERDFPEIASKLGVKTSHVRDMNNRMSSGDLSLNTPYSNDENEGSELIEFIPENRASQDLVIANKQESSKRRQLLNGALSKLNERELDIIQARKLSESPQTLENLSLKYKISKERVRQIENRAFEKIQDYVLTNV